MVIIQTQVSALSDYFQCSDTLADAAYLWILTVSYIVWNGRMQRMEHQQTSTFLSLHAITGTVDMSYLHLWQQERNDGYRVYTSFQRVWKVWASSNSSRTSFRFMSCTNFDNRILPVSVDPLVIYFSWTVDRLASPFSYIVHMLNERMVLRPVRGIYQELGLCLLTYRWKR